MEQQTQPQNEDNASANSGSTTVSSSEVKKNEQFRFEFNKYKNFFEEVKQKGLNGPDMLLTSINNIIRPEDSVIYNPKNNQTIGTKYPVYPLRLKSEMVSKFPDDTLFFIFFEQPDPYAKEMARKELIKRNWIFHLKYDSFFRLKGQPKVKTATYIDGKFDVFDHEKEWKIKDAQLKFEFKDMMK